MVHRAILGSLERFMAILMEHLGGKWPLWISPRQIMVISVTDKFSDYSQKVYNELKNNGWEVEIEGNSNLSLNKKIRNAQLKQFNYIIVIGEEEMSSETVNVRSREGERLGKLSLPAFESTLKS